MKRTRNNNVKYIRTVKKPRRGTAANPIVIGRSTARRTNVRTGGFLGMESKFLDTSYSASIVSSTTSAEADPTGNCLNPVAQGDGESQRDGRRYNVTSVYVKGLVSLAASANTSDPTVQLYLVQDTQTNAAQMNSEDLVTTPSLAINCLRNLQYIKRFKVLKSMRINMKSRGAWDGTQFAQTQEPFEMYVSTNIPVTCTGTTGNVNTISDNSLHVVAIASDASAVLQYSARIRFQG